MMASILEIVSTFLSSHVSHLRAQHLSNHARVAISALSATILAVSLPRVYRNYRTFMSYGPGGVPYNIIGWFVASVILPPLAREMFSTEVYNKKIAAGETTSYLSDESVRARKRDGRPELGPHVSPQRQLTEFPSEEIKEKLNQEFYAFANRNGHLTRFSVSNLELHADALFLADGLVPSPVAQKMKGEIAHIHRLKDFSLHLTLAPADCKKVIEAGWGQRHKLSGVQAPRALFGGRIISLPPEYVFIYAPRTEQEVAFVMEILVASVKYMTGSVEVR
ncbi:uncharacterized protein BDW43DRAFT_269826 [Aspergillus alliaceus]|uniref:uncharacterized protein n=1 Tax=Petromyces alliaceus TaxID=209559 RepID=UPI0012A3BC47|nr:uncharacterized protein BDW43DRAFT_269826 [Aspergillus alliaceus]KAB8235332.1 hypothetical protein BDW43DRAFT_269826 [Aspergillus alliaceus]